MKTRDYWKQREREAKQRQETMRRLDSYNREIERIYKSTLDSIQKEIDAFYGKYAMDTGMTISEAKKRASKLDIEAYGRKAKQYVKERNFSDIANAEMKLYNMTMKVNRLELLKANIGLEMVKNFDELDKFYKDTLTNETVKELRRMSSILGDSVIDTDKANKRYSQAAERIAGASFHNATFSDRVWMHQDLLKHEIDMSLQRALISGTSMQRLASDLRKKFGVSQKNAERLMRTEIRRMQTDAAMESYKRNGNEKYEYMALGQHPCEICSALDGKVFNVKDMEVGLNAPPSHPNCFCSTAPHVDEKAYQEWLDSFAIDNYGEEKTHEWAVGDGRASKVNPGFFSGEKGYKENCQSCVPVYEARRRGMDLEALPFDETNLTQKAVMRNMPIVFGGNWIRTGCTSKRNLLNYLQKNIIDGGRYAFAYTHTILKNGDTRGHVIVAEKVSGKLRLYDPQKNGMFDTDGWIEAYIMQHNIRFKDGNRDVSPRIFRMDNAKFNINILKEISITK